MQDSQTHVRNVAECRRRLPQYRPAFFVSKPVLVFGGSTKHLAVCKFQREAITFWELLSESASCIEILVVPFFGCEA